MGNNNRNEKIFDLLQSLLDDWIDCYGINETIQHLIFNGATKDELLGLQFDENDIDRNIKEIDELEE